MVHRNRGEGELAELIELWLVTGTHSAVQLVERWEYKSTTLSRPTQNGDLNGVSVHEQIFGGCPDSVHSGTIYLVRTDYLTR
jgi:hypothetical protein